MERNVKQVLPPWALRYAGGLPRCGGRVRLGAAARRGHGAGTRAPGDAAGGGLSAGDGARARRGAGGGNTEAGARPRRHGADKPEMPELPVEDVPVAAQAPKLIVEPLRGEVLTAFSMEELIYSPTMGDWRTHDGIDIAAKAGTTVLAASSGTVRSVTDDTLMVPPWYWSTRAATKPPTPIYSPSPR